MNIDSLISCMSIIEKIGQLSLFSDTFRPIKDDELNVNPDAIVWSAEELTLMIREGKVSGLFNGVGADAARTIQRIAVEESRLGIPLIFAADVIHGMKTIFPIPLAEAASFEPEMAYKTARATAEEATAEGLHWTFAPVVDIARDQRWGRVAETTGEDPFLATQFAVARVRGFQTDDLSSENAMLATLKHFVGYGACLAGLDYNSVDMSFETLQEVHLPPFKAGIESGALSVMTSFTDLNGVPCTANDRLLNGVLRDEWHFSGITVSDYTSVDELVTHGFAAHGREAAKLSINAGLDIILHSDLYLEHLPGLLETGEVKIQTIDKAVRRVLSIKEKLGLFDNPYRSLNVAVEQRQALVSDNQSLAKDAAKRSIVMLKNDNHALPLKKVNQKIALIGPFASNKADLAGCWSIFADKELDVDIATGIQASLASQSSLKVLNCCINGSVITKELHKVTDLAKWADVVVLALGEPTEFSGESQSKVSIALPIEQQQLIEHVVSTNKPIVVLLKCGRAVVLPEVIKKTHSILVSWFLGSQTGPALAEVLFGDYNPSGKLPVSFPIADGQQPFYYNRPRTGRPYDPKSQRRFTAHWRETPHEAFYGFGHGLSYTEFAYSPSQLNTHKLNWNDSLEISTVVKNIGETSGEEVVQLYIFDRVASRVRPVRELKNFKKVYVRPQQSITVVFTLNKDDLAFSGLEGQMISEPGMFDLWVCASSQSGDSVCFELLAEEAKILK
ncbi:MAG: beta-glucosidase [Paraglaciecola sp.]|jgi:beta-glucosidase